jgi:hypothetical protein
MLSADFADFADSEGCMWFSSICVRLRNLRFHPSSLTAEKETGSGTFAGLHHSASWLGGFV